MTYTVLPHTKDELIEDMSDAHPELSEEVVARLVDEVFDRIRASLAEGLTDEFRIANFGTFRIEQRGSKGARNSQTGKPIEATPQRALAFRPAGALKLALNDDPHSSK